jgi:hypothetical protein
MVVQCIQCGWCCRQYRGYHWAKVPDLLRWHGEGRRDILRYVSAGRNPAVCRETNTWEWGFGRFGPWGCPVSPP